ncbi:bifunctional diguanylate cyclase/phosphodiesterase [Paenibacillus sp. J31TS4]|uniref:putative bifunctional diguanylate cyclase/phosphodiesterase n=1 Tax=Paenibacillus sp. J31TS4 TaxID=2807195 RepID=UPI001B2946DD|nr:EAL domain-containing protein [Paenibacillus sp. J31TS4]GIP37831.1 bifunctional diguanylate cyclase/phosphodiesterase [Paenibacillus sp. J31TS4]
MLLGQQTIREMIAEGQPLSVILYQLVEGLESALADKLCAIHLVGRTDGVLHAEAAPSLPSSYQRASIRWSIGSGGGACSQAAFRREPVVVTALAEDACSDGWQDDAERHGLRAVWAYPIVTPANRIAGVLAVYSRAAGAPSAEEEWLVDTHALFLGGILETYEAERRIEKLAFYDSLTQLPNRRCFRHRLTETIAERRREHRGKGKAAVLIINLEGFKLINETFGHELGDRILVMASRKLKECMPEEAVLARMDGVKFMALLPRLERLRDVRLRLETILRAFEEPFEYAAHQFPLRADIGVSLYPYHGTAAESLIQHADIAMYHAEAQGRRGFAYYERSMSNKLYDNFMLVSEFTRALRNQEFVLHYQPRYDMSESGIPCVEALVRWNHPTRGIIPPGDFIPLAEDTGFIVPLGKWVLEEACRRNKQWQDAGLNKVRVAVNCSARQLHKDDFVVTVSRALEKAGLDPCYLELEITESALIGSEGSSIRQLRSLREMGVRLAIDDFGTGYSSLHYLMQFEVHSLKIDRTFVKQIPNAAIANTILALGRSLGLRVVAEGVETAEQYDYLKQQGCEEVQGYLLGKPVPPERMEQLLASGYLKGTIG